MRVSFATDNPAVNAVSRPLVSFCPDPTLTAMYQPTLPTKPVLNASQVAWDAVLPRLQAVCRTIAVTKGGRTRSSPVEDELMQLMTEFDLLGNNTILLAETPIPPPHT